MRQRSRLLSVFNKEQVMHVVFLLTACVSIAAVALICAYLLGKRHSHHRGDWPGELLREGLEAF